MNFEFINSLTLVVGSILGAYIAFAIVVFVIAYYILFDPGATTAGKFIFRFMLSLVGVIVLSVIGTLLEPTVPGARSIPPPDVLSWRSLLRIVVYSYVAFAVTSLAVLLALRKWWPERVTSADEQSFVEPRHTTKENPIIRHE